MVSAVAATGRRKIEMANAQLAYGSPRARAADQV